MPKIEKRILRFYRWSFIRTGRYRLKLLLLHLSEDTGIAADLKKRFSGIGIEALLHEYRSDWDRELVEAVREATHLLILVRREILSRKTSAFVLGFSMGKGIPLFLYLLEQVPLPDIASYVFRSEDPESVISYFSGEKKIWTGRRRKEVARNKLVEMGLGVSEESLARITSNGEIVPLKYFLEAGFSPDVRDAKGVPLLCLAVRNDHKTAVELLLENGADINAVSRDRGNTALMDAAAAQNLGLMRYLVDAGAMLDVRSRNGQTALILTVGQKAVEAAEILIKAGADSSISDALGMSARKYAELFGLRGILPMMEG
jgi:hypothetical protein